MANAFDVPLTGSMAPGLLGLVHLPRMWQKGLLFTRGRLPEGYVFGDKGFDQRIMDGVGIDPEAFVPYLKTSPTYLETEAWVRAHATKLDAVAATSETIVNRAMSDVNAAKLRAAAGIADESFNNGALLGNIDDWVSLHAYVVANRGKTLGPIIPAITSLAVGQLGVLHLPRLWGKAMIKTLGALPEGYHSGSGPLDEQLADTIGMDLAASVSFTNAELPPYLVYERWVREHATKLDADTVAAWNTRMRTREKPVPLAAEERKILGITDESERRGVLLNDLIDWHLWHEEITK
ncbi:MAG TPA: DUF5069 domain-containing protein [Candidatus Lustribacter sp.]|nr:DUF5069 domain-containing protein [Candidatus Lustribacter sp.]